MDYHKRQPWAVLVAVIFLPIVSCDDGGSTVEEGASSFGSAVRFFRNIADRRNVSDAADRFEAVFIALYDGDENVRFFDVMAAPPKNRRPSEAETMDLEEIISRIRDLYDERNSPPFVWADESRAETTPLDLDDDGD